MEVHRKTINAVVASDRYAKYSKTKNLKQTQQTSLYLTNAVFFTFFFSFAYFLLHQWRHKIRTSTPLHVLTISEIAAVVSLTASVVYLMSFFGIGIIFQFHPSSVHYDEEEEEDEADIAKKIRFISRRSIAGATSVSVENLRQKSLSGSDTFHE
jgi:hydroxymethylglutaryl-CoA reductase (NADPH)